MNCQRGDIVVIDWPFSDRTGAKVRRALVVQSDDFNQQIDDTILAAVTRSSARFVGSPTQVVIDITTSDGQQSGLRQTSVIQCENLLTVDQGLVLRRIGSLSSTSLGQVNDALKVALGLQ